MSVLPPFETRIVTMSRPVVLGVTGIAAAFVIGLLLLVIVQQHSPYRQNRVGGAFTLTETTGTRVTERDLLGKPTAITFGFTFCPDVCPTTLFMLSQALQRIGRDAGKLNVVFVTVDPERDTPDQMKLYLSSFDPRIRGFTGSSTEVADMANAYHVTFRRVPVEGGGYTVDHSAGVMLFDARGKIVGQIGYDETPDQAAAKLSTLLQPNACIPGGPPRVDLWNGATLQGCGA
jgi:protein SCO1